MDDWSGYAADTNDDDDRLTISICLLFDIDKRFGGEIRVRAVQSSVFVESAGIKWASVPEESAQKRKGRNGEM